jgi:hypothetical protein
MQENVPNCCKVHDVECEGDEENGMPRKETEDLGRKDIEKRTKIYLYLIKGGDVIPN